MKALWAGGSALGPWPAVTELKALLMLERGDPCIHGALGPGNAAASLCENRCGALFLGVIYVWKEKQ